MENFITDDIEAKSANSPLKSYQNLYMVNKQSSIKKWMYGILIALVLIAFLPWTQTIRAKGSVTTILQEQLPLEVNAVIAGKVLNWHVKEGDHVKAGDTILQGKQALNQLYYVTAPQSGQISNAKKVGLGEMVKEGEMLVEIEPENIQLAVELFIEPMDLPLVSKGQKMQFVFDGFPAIVFSGWPESSYGTFAGRVASIENAMSSNGKFRILVKEDSTQRKWPQQLRRGVAAQGIGLLKDVSIWYELWRNINGFPPEYYRQ
jgi:multidrug resistance efflux pump